MTDMRNNKKWITEASNGIIIAKMKGYIIIILI